MPIGLPEIRDNLNEQQPSLMRIFRVIEIDKLSNNEVAEFFEKAFEKANMKIDKDALPDMIKYSSGLPILMHEIGDAIFWINEDEIITSKDAINGIFEAAERIGKKYLDPKIYRAIRSEKYRSIVRKMGNLDIAVNQFKTSDILKILNEKEKKVFNNFLRKMLDVGLINRDFESGISSYKYANALYRIYINMESKSRAHENHSRKT